MARGRPVLNDTAGELLHHHGRWYIRSAGTRTYACGTRAVEEGILPHLREESFDHKTLVPCWFAQERRPDARPPVPHARRLDHPRHQALDLSCWTVAGPDQHHTRGHGRQNGLKQAPAVLWPGANDHR